MTVASQSRLSPHRPPPRAESRPGELLVRRQRRSGLQRTAAAARPALAAAGRLRHQSSIRRFLALRPVLDTACMLGAIPPGYGWQRARCRCETYFALAARLRDGPVRRRWR